ncbi:RING finger protein 150-like protein [Lates japonicus]|uniref:RING finger protein 150-like protein n=1 Tax=Lates japonicus TaxID=270547 RepID=A0AAD3NAR9_LATJO|nr:RING finger protein 150-like protein [Lates japonicus]
MARVARSQSVLGSPWVFCFLLEMEAHLGVWLRGCPDTGSRRLRCRRYRPPTDRTVRRREDRHGPGLLVAARRSLALTWLLSASRPPAVPDSPRPSGRSGTPPVNITHDPATPELRTEKTECGRYGEHSPKRDAKGVLVLPAAPHDRQACDPNTRFAVPAQAGAWIALIARAPYCGGDKIRPRCGPQRPAVVILIVGPY